MQCFRNVCKKDLRECHIDTQSWESLADDRDLWKRTVKDGIATFEANQKKDASAKRKRRKKKASDCQSHPPQNSGFVCNLCGKDCDVEPSMVFITTRGSRKLSN